MTRAITQVLLALLVLVGCHLTPPMTVETLLAENARARGGVALLESLEAVRYQLEITEPGFSVTATYVATRSGYMRIDVYAGEERVFTEALGPEGGWQLLQGATAATPLSEEGYMALVRGRDGNIRSLHELPALGYSFTLEGLIDHHGNQRWLLEKRAPDGFTEYLYIDPETFLVVASSEVSALHPDIDDTKSAKETWYQDYQTTDGILISRSSEKRNLMDGKELQRTRVTSVEINPGLDLTRFQPPNQ